MQLGEFIFNTYFDEDFIANDGSSFSSSYIESVRNELKVFTSLHFNNATKLHPENYEEDFVQASRRNEFKINDWIIVGVAVHSNDSLSRVLLIHKDHLKEGLVYDFSLSIVSDVFYRGFAIKEDSESDPVEDDIFLPSIGFDNEIEKEYEFELPSYIDAPDFEELSYIEIKVPVFEPTKKKKIVNFGGEEIFDVEEVEEDDEEDLVIEVEKPVFQARGKSKVRNLGYAGDTPKRVKKEIEAPAHIDVEKPAFEANKSSKVRNLGYSNQEPQKKVEKPVSKPIEVETPKFEASSKKKPTNYDEVIKKENRNWKVIDTYRVKPNVFKGERSLISKEDASEKALLSKTVEILQGISSIMVDDNCVFVPKVLDEESPKLKAMRNFKLDYFNILFSVTDSDDDIIKAVIVSKDLQDTFVIGFYPSPRIEVYSSIGVSLDDRARPYYSFEQLLKLTND